MRRQISTAAALLACTFVLVTPSLATEVYRWVDEDGIIHFSDTEPDQGHVETLEVADRNPPDYDPATDPYNILNQAERTAEMLARAEKKSSEREERDRRAENDFNIDGHRRAPYLYGLRNSWFAPPFFPPQRPGQRPAFRQQWQALEQAGLNQPRPASINSGEHASRVERSQSLPLTSPGPRRP